MLCCKLVIKLSIFVTGDVHGQLGIKRLTKQNFPEQFKLTRQDYLIQLGDLGLLWKKDKTYKYLLDFYTSRNYTLLWIDGNHENFTMLNNYPVIEWNGGNVHIIADNIIHLMRGQVYNIEDCLFFTLGGGKSLDKSIRTLDVTWWKEEELNYNECINAIDNLEKYDYQVDYVITHSAPFSVKNLLGFEDTSTTERFLQQLINQYNITFNKWFIGHYHLDNVISDKFYFIYNNIYKLK